MIKFQRCFLMMLFGCLLLLATAPASVSAEMNLRYSSCDHWGDETTFILSYESPAKTINAELGNRSVEVGLMNQEHGRYLVRGDAEVAGLNEFSFDVSDYPYPYYYVFTIYEGGSKSCRLIYNYRENIIKDLDYGITYQGYNKNGNNQSGMNRIPPHMATLICIDGNHKVGSRFSVQHNGMECWYEVIPYPENATPTDSVPANLPNMWYKLTDENDRNVWSAFTYDTSTGVFSMYHKNFDDEIVLYSYRKFLANGQLSVQSVDDDASSAASAVYTLDRNGYYTNGMQPIAKYVTDGMHIFLQQLNR